MALRWSQRFIQEYACDLNWSDMVNSKDLTKSPRTTYRSSLMGLALWRDKPGVSRGMTWNRGINLTRERAGSRGEKLQLQINSKPNQHVSFQWPETVNAPLCLSQFKPGFLSLGKFVTDTRGKLRVSESVLIRRDKILILPELLQNLWLIALSQTLHLVYICQRKSSIGCLQQRNGKERKSLM